MLRTIGSLILKQNNKGSLYRFISSSSSKWQLESLKDESDERLLVTVENGVKRVTLNDLKKRNALSLDLLNALKRELIKTNNDESVQVLILGHNGRVFSAGHDLKELRGETGSQYHTKVFQRCSEVMNLVQDIHVPVIAEVKGVATAAGCQLVATCDLAVASDTSVFAAPGVHIGLFCSTPGVAIARSVSRKQAMKMLLTGDPISAQEAQSSGLINEVVPEDQVAKTSEELAAKIVRHSRPVIALGKETFYKQIKENRNDAYCLAENVMVENLRHDDAQEGISAFFEKRKPKWT